MIILLKFIMLFIFILSMVSVIVVSYGKQQEKYHRRHREWMKENLRNENE